MSNKYYLDLKGVFMKKNFYLPKSYDIAKGQGAIDDLNNLLNDVGVTFSVSKKDNGLKLFISVDEKKLQEATSKPKLGRPTGYEFDIEKVEQMKSEGKTNKEIYQELGMSKSLFYLRMKEYK